MATGTETEATSGKLGGMDPRSIRAFLERRQVHVEYLVPTRMVESKKKLMKYGRRQKADGIISSYDVMVKNNEPVLRTFKHGEGVSYVKIDEIEQHQQDSSQMDI